MKCTIGVMAHVDAGKTTLIEQLMVAAGRLKEAGRVDHGTAFLDSDAQERARGITISSKSCRLSAGDLSLTLIDTPGHVDFTAETERVLPVLDAAILLIGAGNRIPAHAGYLFRLLQERSIPTLVFFNKMDLPVPGREELMKLLRQTLGEGFTDWYGDPAQRDEEAAVLDDALTEHFLAEGQLPEGALQDLFQRGKLFPVVFGSALQGKGVTELLQMMQELLGERQEKADEGPFGAYCYKILHDMAGQKLSFLKILSGRLSVREQITYSGRGEDEEYTEKVTGIRLYDGADFLQVQEALPGDIVALTGLSSTFAGCGLGIAPSLRPESSRPMLSYRLILPEGTDPAEFLPKLRQLEEEETTLSVEWFPERAQINVTLYGGVQMEILTERIRERFGLQVSFDEGNVVYRETLAAPSYGVGHFEPLRHYAEVHFLLEPLPRGTGLLVESRLSTDELDRNWQQTILNAVRQEELTGVLVNARLTDLRITLVAGRSHKKHTEGGDFREAALRAIRQGLMSGNSLLLEPYVRFSLTVPQESAGRALYDMDQRAQECRITEQGTDQVTMEGRGAVSKLRNYVAEVRAYTRGEGVFRMLYDGYDEVPDAENVVEMTGYDPESDQEHPSSSVFVDHGAADLVPWDLAPERMHLFPRFGEFYPELSKKEQKEPEDVTKERRRTGSVMDRLSAIGTEEIDRILQQAGHANETAEHARERKNRWTTATRRKQTPDAGTKNRTMYVKKPASRSYLLVDGYNILHAWEETKGLVGLDLNAARNTLLEILTEYRALSKEEIIVVFDAYRVPGHTTEVMEYQNLHVVYTRTAETADQYIARFAKENEKNYDITVATSDGMIQLIIRGANSRLLSARDLHDAVKRKKDALGVTYL